MATVPISVHICFIKNLKTLVKKIYPIIGDAHGLGSSISESNIVALYINLFICFRTKAANPFFKVSVGQFECQLRMVEGVALSHIPIG